MSPLNQALLAALLAAVLVGALLVVCFPPPKPHPGNHRGTSAEPVRPVLTLAEHLPARPVMYLPDVAARAGQPQAWARYVGRVTVPDWSRSYLPAKHEMTAPIQIGDA